MALSLLLAAPKDPLISAGRVWGHSTSFLGARGVGGGIPAQFPEGFQILKLFLNTILKRHKQKARWVWRVLPVGPVPKEVSWDLLENPRLLPRVEFKPLTSQMGRLRPTEGL